MILNDVHYFYSLLQHLRKYVCEFRYLSKYVIDENVWLIS